MNDERIVQVVIQAVAEMTGITPDDIIGSCRSAPIIEARFTAQWIMFSTFNRSITAIAPHFHRHQSVVSDAIRKTSRRYRTDREYRDAIEQIAETIRTRLFNEQLRGL